MRVIAPPTSGDHGERMTPKLRRSVTCSSCCSWPTASTPVTSALRPGRLWTRPTQRRAPSSRSKAAPASNWAELVARAWATSCTESPATRCGCSQTDSKRSTCASDRIRAWNWGRSGTRPPKSPSVSHRTPANSAFTLPGMRNAVSGGTVPRGRTRPRGRQGASPNAVAARYPAAITRSMFAIEKSSWLTPLTSDDNQMSPGRSGGSGCSKTKARSCPAMDRGSSSLTSNRDVSRRPETMTRVAPRRRAAAMGTLSTMPPSARSRPPTRTERKMMGIALLARTACPRSPPARTTCSRVLRSAAIARNGTGSRSKSPAAMRLPRAYSALTSALSSRSRTTLVRSISPLLPRSQTRIARRVPSDAGVGALYRPTRESRPIAFTSRSISATSSPLAHSAPMMAPALVPTTTSGTTPSESSMRRTPRWANPFAPPPGRTSASLPSDGAQTGACARPGAASRTVAETRTRKRQRISCQHLPAHGVGQADVRRPLGLRGRDGELQLPCRSARR